MEQNNIFKNAYFGKAYKTRDGKKAIYHGSEEHKSGDGRIWLYHYLMLEPEISDFLGKNVVINLYEPYINDNGIGRFANLKYCKGSGANAGYDIVSEWQEEMNEEKFRNEIEEYAENMMIIHCKEHHIDCPNHIIKDAIRRAYEDGHRKEKQE